MTPRAAHPYEHLWGTDSFRKEKTPEWQAAYSLTWFVTSSVVGLYVVMPCVPTEKTRLYLEQRWVRNTVYPSANTSNSLGSHITLIANVGKRVTVQWELAEAKWTDHLISLVIKVLNVKMYLLTQKRSITLDREHGVVKKRFQPNVAPHKLMSQQQVTSWWFHIGF